MRKISLDYQVHISALCILNDFTYIAFKYFCGIFVHIVNRYIASK